MKPFMFEVEERHLYRFIINAKDPDQANRMFVNNPDYYLSEENKRDILTDVDIT